MNRVIKFRVWNSAENRMSYFDLNTSKGCSRLSIDFCNEDYTELMQFTGLKAKNGKEIFEGDIVEISFGLNERIGTVQFIEGSFEIGNSTNDKLCERKFWFRAIRDEVIKVIGNIYENPELLNDVSREKAEVKK